MYIYKLEFEDGSVYIGKTLVTVEDRYTFHRSLMKRGKHHSKKLQKAYDKYGEPTVTTIEEVAIGADIDVREQYWISHYDSYNNGLNCTPGGGKYYGQNNKYSESDYVAAVCLLANTDMTIREISEELDVTHGVVQSIMYGKSHTYLKNIVPNEYQEMLDKLGFRNLKKGRCVSVRDPHGALHTVVNAAQFCRDHELQQANFNAVLNGKRKSHKGWTLALPEDREKILAKAKPVLAKLKSPDGCVLDIVDFKEFAQRNNLHLTSLKRLISGEFKQHKGWTRYE